MERRLLLTGGALLGLLALILVLGSADTALGGTFNPEARFCFDDFTTVDPNPTVPGDPGECDGDNSAGAPSTFTTGFAIPTGDVQFGGIVTYIPNEWSITPGDEFPIGTRVGRLESIATIGLLNNQCDNILTLVGLAGFELFNASLDINDTIEFEEESGGVDPNREDWAEDLDGDTLIEAINKYPAFTNRVIDDEEGNPQQPFRRSAGRIIVAGQDVLIQLLIYEPGTFISKHLTNDPALGYPTVVTLQNIGDPEIVPEPEPITDFCSPLEAATTVFGTGDGCDSLVNDDPDDDDLINDGCPALATPESEAEPREGTDPCANNIDDDMLDDLEFSRAAGLGEEARVNDGCPQAGDTSEDDIDYVLYRNPSEEGNYTLTGIAVGQPDADGDGIENALDTCPFVENEGDPRIKGDGDLDEDGLDAACDPNDDPLTGGLNSDEDLDGYLNRQDNCPLVANGEEGSNQKESDVDDDDEDMWDQIGDDCDTDPLVFNGETVAERLRTIETKVEIGPGEGAPTDGEDDDGEDDDGGGAAVIIIVVVVAAVVVVGGGAWYLMRRRGA